MEKQIRIRMTESMLKELTEKTGVPSSELVGVALEIGDENELIIRDAFNTEDRKTSNRIVAGSTECSCVEANMWQGQSGCANHIKQC
jgi:hypothetical protein